MAIFVNWRRRTYKSFLTNKAMGLRPNSVNELLLLSLAHLAGTMWRFIIATKSIANQQFVQMLKYILQLGFLAAPPGSDRGNEQILPEEVLANTWQKGK